MIIITGTSTNDVLHYTSDFRVMGLAGNDSLKAGNMKGGPGDDEYYVVAATDQVIENADEGTRDYVISGLGSYTLTSNVEDLYLEDVAGRYNGTGNQLDNSISGNRYANTLTGGDGKDTLSGYAGNDTLRGGNHDDHLNGSDIQSVGKGEVDVLFGGGGRDSFIAGGSFVYYNDGNSSSAGLNDYALIQDFNKAEDRIFLSATKGVHSLGASPVSVGSGTRDTAIFYNYNGAVSELVAVIQDVDPSTLSLNGTYFTFGN